MKKFFSLVLALVMALSLTTIAWGAATIYVDGTNGNDTTGTGAVDAPFATLAKAVESTAETDVTINVAAGNYTLPVISNKNVTFVGDRTAIFDISAQANTWHTQFPGTSLAFVGVTVKSGNVNYRGLNVQKLSYTGCAIEGLQFLYAPEVTFTNCELDAKGAEHCVWTYGAQNVTFTECKFTYGDRGINVYCDNDIPGGKQTVKFEDCIFTTTNTASDGAVEINSSKFSAGADVSLNDCTAPANGEMAYVSQWDSTGGAKTDVFVDDALVGGVAEVVGGAQYKTLAEAVAAAPAGGTVKLLADCDENVTVDKALTFDFNGYTYSGVVTPAAGYTYMDGVVKKTPAASGTTSTGSVTSGTVTATKAKMYRLATAGTSMTELFDVTKIEKTTVTGKLVNDVPAYVPDIYKINDTTYYVEVAKADATFALKNNGAYVYLAPAGTASNVDAVVAKFATAVVLDQYVAAAEDVECGDAVKGTKGAAIYKSGNDAYYADGSNWAYFNGEFVKYDKNTKVAFKAHTWDATSIIVKATDVKGTKVPVTIECEDCEKTFSIVPSAKFDNTWVKGVNYTTDKAVDKYNTAAVKYYIVLENATYTSTYVPSVPSTDKVTSAETFDAGIAMYVGMSVMAAAGSVVVLKKRED